MTAACLCASRMGLFQHGAPESNRTTGLPLRRGLLYPLSYRGVARILPNPAGITEPVLIHPDRTHASYDAYQENTCWN